MLFIFGLGIPISVITGIYEATTGIHSVTITDQYIIKGDWVGGNDYDNNFREGRLQWDVNTHKGTLALTPSGRVRAFVYGCLMSIMSLILTCVGYVIYKDDNKTS